MYTALYRTERPETFDEVLGQDHIVKILRNQVKTGTVSHAYLFCGTRGTGKTSVARILAKAVNCTGEGEKPCGTCPNCQSIQKGSFLDVIEIDAASNNGVESVREIRESVIYPPTVGKRKVYIIDEAHELTSHALNALLKTLEEPPENVMFILATTDPQKLLQTIISRCLRLDFHRVPETIMKEHMSNICGKRGVEITEGALNLLANNSDGSVRDGLSLLDQCLAGVEGGTNLLDRDTVLDYLGTVSEDFFIRLTESVISKDPAVSLVMLDEVLRQGKDVKQILADWMRHYRSLLIGKYVADPENMLNMSDENVARLTEQSKRMPIDDINNGIMRLAKTINDARYSPQPRILMEMAIVDLCGATPFTPAAPARPAASAAPAQKAASEKPAPAAPARAPKAEPAPAPTPEPESAPVPEPEQAAPEPEQAVPEPVTEEAQASEPPTEAAPTQEASANSELADIWSRVWDNINDPGSITMVRINADLVGLSQDEFKLVTESNITMNIAEKNRKMIEETMEQVVGRPLKMVITLVEPKEVEVQENMLIDSFALQREDESIWDENPSDEMTDEELKEAIENRLNIKLRIED